MNETFQLKIRICVNTECINVYSDTDITVISTSRWRLLLFKKYLCAAFFGQIIKHEQVE